jgi:uncharacterized protein (TIGR00730 family)
MKSVCVFCGSSIGREPAYMEAAGKMGKLLADRKIRLVYGGANVGLMGMVAKTCLENNGEAVGVMPRNLVEMEVANDRLTELKVVESMHERKTVMNELSDGFISMPGGIGTLEETFEMFTWMQLGLHNKPVGLLNTLGFFDKLGGFLEHVVKNGFLLQCHLEMLLVDQDEENLLERLLNHRPERIDKWFDKEKNRV